VKRQEYDRMFEAEDRHWWYAGMRAISLALLRPQLREPARILDAGCGTGRNLVALGAFGAAFGVDLAPEAIDYCRERGVRSVRGSVLALPFRADAFDLVTSFDVLYHRWVEDDRVAALELGRVLRPGGLLLVRVPALKLLWGAHDSAVHSRHRYGRQELAELLEQAGFEVLRTSYANFFLFPLLLLRRSLDRLLRRQGSDLAFLPAPFEALFRSLLGLEARLLGVVSLPVGASLFALARRRQLT